MPSERAWILLIMLAAVLALSVGETFLSKGMKQTAEAPPGWRRQAWAIASNGWILAGGGLLVLHVGLYMAAMRGADLSFVLPLTAASYPLAAVLAKYYLHEDVGLMRWAGMLLITIGVAVVGMDDAQAGR